MVYHKSIHLNHPLKGQIHKQTQMLLLLKNKELAEDRLPEEIKEENIYIPKEKTIYWFGSANHTNTHEIRLFYDECIKNDIEQAAIDPGIAI